MKDTGAGMNLNESAQAPGGTGPLLDVSGLHTHFYTPEGVVRALNGVDLRLEEGHTLGIVGESGCGKTVLALTILRLHLLPGRRPPRVER